MNIISQTFLEAIKKGAISLAWRLLAVAVVGILGLLANSIELLNLSPEWIVVIGGILGEITKQAKTWSDTKLGVAKKLGLN